MARPKAPYKLLYNNDTTNTMTCVSPWHEEGEDFREEMLVASIEETADTGVDVHILSPGMGWIPWWQSRVLPDHFTWWKEQTGLEPERYEKYVYEGGDMVQVLVDTCRKHGMSPFVSLRLNDVHLQEYYGTKDWRSAVCCRMYTEHPEWHLDPDHPKREGYYGRRGMDWAIKEVRDYKMLLLTELCENYDLDGLELDFLRHSMFFRDDMPENKRIEIMTGFITELREVMDKNTEDGKRMNLSVRIPTDPGKFAELGIDAQQFYETGVDMFNLSGWYHIQQQTGTAEVKSMVPEAAVYVEMTHSTGNHRYFLKPGIYNTAGNPRTSDHQYYTTAELAYTRGADGVSLFNFQYYRMNQEMDIPVTEPPFHVLSKLTDKEFLSRQPQYYFLGNSVYSSQMPMQLKPETSQEFTLDMAPHPVRDKTSWRKHAAHDDSSEVSRLRIHTEDPVPDRCTFTVTFNGTELEICEDLSRYLGNPYDRMISPDHNRRRAWVIPREIITDGQNAVEITVSESLNIIFLDVWVV